MIITQLDADTLFFDESDVGDLIYVETMDWEDDGKYSLGGVIFQKENKFYKLHINRNGSYHTDYYYDFILDCPEVKKVEIVTYMWKTVK